MPSPVIPTQHKPGGSLQFLCCSLPGCVHHQLSLSSTVLVPSERACDNSASLFQVQRSDWIFIRTHGHSLRVGVLLRKVIFSLNRLKGFEPLPPDEFSAECDDFRLAEITEETQSAH